MNPQSINSGYKKYVNWDTVMTNENMQKLWDKDTLLKIQKTITEQLKPLCPNPIIVPLDKIGHVLFQCYEANNPKVGNIYSRHILPEIEATRADLCKIIDRTVNIIVNQIRNEFLTIQNNRSLTVWNSLYGEFNQQGLRAHSQIKLREKRVPQLQFHMNY